MTIEDVKKLALECYRGFPTIVLGSGASMPHGLPGMETLTKFLTEELETEGKSEEDSWLEVRRDLALGHHLEGALEGKNLPTSLTEKIVRLTWQCVNEHDEKVFHATVSGEQFPLGSLLQNMLRSTNSTVNVVTTNYDRVVEYACNSVDLLFQTGFTPGYRQKWESGDGQVRFQRGPKQARAVKIWKVHGSLDWFSTEQGLPIGIPSFGLPSQDLSPLIVTPGLNKYEKITEDPFRSTFNGADDALKHAGAFLCVGYGFRDKQLHPKIEQRCREGNIPVVVLAYELTNEAKDFLKNRAGKNYLGLECSGDGSKVYTIEKPDGFDLDVPNIWSLEGFSNLVT